MGLFSDSFEKFFDMTKERNRTRMSNLGYKDYHMNKMCPDCDVPMRMKAKFGVDSLFPDYYCDCCGTTWTTEDLQYAYDDDDEWDDED